MDRGGLHGSYMLTTSFVISTTGTYEIMNIVNCCCKTQRFSVVVKDTIHVLCIVYSLEYNPEMGFLVCLLCDCVPLYLPLSDDCHLGALAVDHWKT